LAALLYYFFLLPLSWLPFWALYGISNAIRFVLYHIFKFRVSVIRQNLANSFPEKSPAERKAIEKEFYKHMCDLIVESIKYFTISETEAKKRMGVRNTAIFEDLYAKGKSAVIVGGHYGSWELYALTVNEPIPHQTYALFTPLSQPFFNKKMKSSRSRYGLKMVHYKEVTQLFTENANNRIGVIFGSDQSPRDAKKAYWMTFLHQDTGVQFGAEKYATAHNCAVVYGQINKLGRGHYEIEYRLITEEAEKEPYGYITETHTKWLEDKIISEPSYWLWSHRRWKHKRPDTVSTQ
jgi:KDO2-lipid IV(A) lauroyltransferase